MDHSPSLPPDDGPAGLDPTELDPDLELVAQLLAEGNSDAASGLGIGRSSKYVQRARRDNPAFVARVIELKEARALQAAAGLGSLLDDAVEAVRRGLQAERPGDQLRAAALVFDRYRTFHADSEAAEKVNRLASEVVELRAQVAALVAQIAGGGATHG